MLGLVGDALGVRLSHRRHPVRQEHDHAQLALRGRLDERFGERAGNVGAAVGVETADPFLGGPHVVTRHLRPAGGVATHAAPEGDHTEPVPRPEGPEELRQRGFRLIELVTRHGA